MGVKASSCTPSRPRTGVWDVCRPNDLANLIKAVELGRETAVRAEDLLVDDGTQWEAVENLCEELPQFGGVPSLAWGGTAQRREGWEA